MAGKNKLTELFREAGVYNPHNFYAGQPYISWESSSGRGHTFQGWKVHKQGEVLSEPWYNNGSKPFSTFSAEGKTFAERKAFALEQAKVWASEYFGVEEWARDPYGSWGPAEYVAARVAELKQPRAAQEVYDLIGELGAPDAP